MPQVTPSRMPSVAQGEREVSCPILNRAMSAYCMQRWGRNPQFNVGSRFSLDIVYYAEDWKLLLKLSGEPRPPLEKWWTVDEANLPG